LKLDLFCRVKMGDQDTLHTCGKFCEKRAEQFEPNCVFSLLSSRVASATSWKPIIF